MAARVVSEFGKYRIVEKDVRSDYESCYFFESKTDYVDALGVVRWELIDSCSANEKADKRLEVSEDKRALILRVVGLEKKLAEAEAKAGK